jgi:hypothetical protein
MYDVIAGTDQLVHLVVIAGDHRLLKAVRSAST